MLPKPLLTSEPIVELLPERPKRGDNLKSWQFKPGQSGNPGGKKVGTRNTLTGDFLKCLAEDFNKNGQKVISKARNKDPLGYIKVIASLLPKQMEKVQPLEELSDAELAAGIALLKSHSSVASSGRIAKEAPKGARPAKKLTKAIGLQAVQEAEGVSSQAGPGTDVDGSEPGRQDVVGGYGTRDALDGAVPGLVEGPPF